MRFKFSIMLIVLTIGVMGEARTPKPKPKTPYYGYAYYAQASEKRDTLYLVHNDTLSAITKRIWESDTSRLKPRLVFVNTDQMRHIKQRLSYGKNK